MKKILCILMVLLLVASFAACSKKGDAEDDLSKYLQDEEVVDKVKTDGGDLFYIDSVDTTTVIVTGYEGSHELHEVTIPDTLAGKKVIGIGDRAFYYCNTITAVKLPATLTSIGTYAFAGCSFLSSVTIPASVKTIGNGAFYGCERLVDLTLEAGDLTEISEACFWGCSSLTSVEIPGSVKTVGKGAFFACASLETLVVNEGVEEIRDQAFQNLAKLANVTLPETTECAPLAFAGTAWGERK